MALPCSSRVLGLHGSNSYNHYPDDALFLPGSVQLDIIPPGFPRDFVVVTVSSDRVFVILDASAGRLDVYATAGHMNPEFIRPGT
jgi:hypothetical protein